MHPLSMAVADALTRKGARVDVTEGPVSVEHGVIEIPIFVTTRGADPETVALSVGAVPESGRGSATSHPISTASERVVRGVTGTAREAAGVWAKAQQRADQEEITHGLGARGETEGDRRRKEAALDASLFSPELLEDRAAPTREGMRDAILNALAEDELDVNATTRGGLTRIYVERELSRGPQKMGYIEIDADGDVNASQMVRAKARIRDIATGAIRSYRRSLADMTPDPVAAPAPAPDPVPDPVPDPRLTVYYSPAGGILIKGTQREDAQAIKRLSSPRFRWSARQRFWYVPRSRGGRLRTQGEIERIRDELAAAKGEPVALDYRRMQRTPAEILETREQAEEAAQHRREARAERARSQADAATRKLAQEASSRLELAVQARTPAQIAKERAPDGSAAKTPAKKAAKKAPKKKPAKAKPKKKAPKKKPGRPPARARGRARERYVDPVTGQDVPGSAAGAVPTGNYIARARARKDAPLRTVEIQPDELGAASYQIDLEQRELELRAQERGRQIAAERAIEAELAKLKGKQALPGVSATFRTAGAAAREFLTANEFYYSPITAGSVDITVAVEDWAAGQVVWVPRKGRRKGSTGREQGDMRPLGQTTKGQRILSVAHGMGSAGNERLLLAVLTWIFSQSRSKRYRDVPWEAIESLNDHLEGALEAAGETDAAAHRGAQATPVYPAASGRYAGGELVQHPDVQASPRAVQVAQADANLGELTAVLRDLKEAYAAGRPCLAPDMRRAVLRRIRYLKELEAHPHRIARAKICAHARIEASAELIAALTEAGQEIDEYDSTCTFPVLLEDTRRLTRVCQEGYDAGWTTAAAGEWSEDPERHHVRLEATPGAVLRHVATQTALFESAAPSAPTYREAESQLDEAEFEIFGPASDDEIPF